MARFTPADLGELREVVAGAAAASEGLEVVAGGSKRGLGRPLQTPHVLEMSRIAGVRDYAPSELVLTAAAATPLADIEKLLGQHGQMLAFEPPDWRGLLDGGGEPTLGGILACNLSGPRRFKAGAARDHFLGFRGVSGRGDIFKAGGKVVKNVTGYDLPKLLAGAYGTLAVLEEVTVKVLPRPEHVETLLFPRMDRASAMRVMTIALGSPHEVSGAAFLPDRGGGVALRLEGPPPSVAARRDSVLRDLDIPAGKTELIEDREATELWRGIGNAAPLCGVEGRAVWRVSVAPARGAEVAGALAAALDAAWFLDWGGALIWAAVPEHGDAGAAAIRAAIRGTDGRGTGHATLIKGSPGLRRSVPVFEPLAGPLAALTRRIKEAFDPAHILNPGRMADEG